MSYTYTHKIQGVTVSTNSNALIPLVDKQCSLESVLRLEEHLKSMEGADTSGGDVTDHFSDGLYARELHLPAGSCIVGEMHLKGQINFLMKGTIVVTTAEGTKELSAPRIIVSPPGTKRAGYALTDVTWVTVSHTHKKTVDEVRADIIATDLNDPRLEGIVCLGVQ